MIGHGEPEIFEKESWTSVLQQMFQELRKTGIDVPSDDAIALMLPMIQDKYQAMGGRSQHVAVIKRQSELVAQCFPEHVFGCGFNEFSSPHFKDIAAQMMGDKITRLVFVPMMLTDSSHTQEIAGAVRSMGIEKHGVAWVMSRPLFYRPEPAQLVVENIMRAAGTTPLKNAGVVLASHGEPDQWSGSSEINTHCNEQETAFALCVKKGLVERGFLWENVVRGFNEFTKPELSEAAELLAGKKVDKVIAAAVFGTTDCIHVNYDIPAKVKKALDGSTVEVVCLEGWNEDPLLITAYCGLITESLDILAAVAG